MSPPEVPDPVRTRADRRGSWCAGLPWWGEDPRDYRITRWLFLRLLGVVYLIAFLSLWSQIDGLFGSGGILPVGDYLQWLERVGPERHWRLPTLLWLNHSDAFLHALCATGVLLALLLIVGVAPVASLLLLWASYLSLTLGGQVFFSFQWDTLLLEAGFLALFLAPRRWLPRWPRGDPAPSQGSLGGLWLLRLLLVKLMVLSGLVKLISLDSTWWDLTALDYHYFTQPLPTWTAWYAHQLPGWLQKLSVLGMFAVEIGAPFLMFGPRGARLACCWLQLALQLGIAATGNYGFFNLLTMVLCVCLLDDRFLIGLVPSRLQSGLRHVPGDSHGPPTQRSTRRQRAPENVPAAGSAAQPRLRTTRLSDYSDRLLAAAMAALLFLSGLTFVDELVRTSRGRDIRGWTGTAFDWSERFVLGWGRGPLRWVGPFRSVNGYGLFRAMTTQRPEIVVEGSLDGRDWKPYRFRWKPGEPQRRPRFVAPHMPRLDWQMWFAALNPRRAGWLEGLIRGLLEGRPEVLRLFAASPFAEPPRYVRLAYYQYRFTTIEERRATGHYWIREPQGYLGRPVSLEDLRR